MAFIFLAEAILPAVKSDVVSGVVGDPTDVQFDYLYLPARKRQLVPKEFFSYPSIGRLFISWISLIQLSEPLPR